MLKKKENKMKLKPIDFYLQELKISRRDVLEFFIPDIHKSSFSASNKEDNTFWNAENEMYYCYEFDAQKFCNALSYAKKKREELI